MKILCINSLYRPNLVGGAERVVETLATALSRSGHEVVVVTSQPHGDASSSCIDGVRIYYIPTRNLYRSFSDARPGALRKAVWHLVDTYNPLMRLRLEEIMYSERPDIVNSHNLAGFSVSAWSAARRVGIPIVHAIHDPYLLCPKSSMYKNHRNCQRRCVDCYLYSAPRSHATEHVDVVVGVSRFILERHKHFGLFAAAESRVIYNGLYPVGLTHRRVARVARCLRFGFLGQIRATKGLHLLIDAILSRNDIESELLICGKGDADYEAHLRMRTRGCARIQWLGYAEDLKAFFDGIDILTVPSLWHDTAPLVILEAFNHCVPVLGSNRGGIPEFISHETGWIFDPDREGDLGDALARCNAEKGRLREMGKAAQLMAANRGQLSRMSDEYLDAYEFARRSFAVRT